jgi:hypothetical protein
MTVTLFIRRYGQIAQVQVQVQQTNRKRTNSERSESDLIFFVLSRVPGSTVAKARDIKTCYCSRAQSCSNTVPDESENNGNRHFLQTPALGSRMSGR